MSDVLEEMLCARPFAATFASLGLALCCSIKPQGDLKMDLNYVEDIIRVVWFITLLVWIVFYLDVQWVRLPLPLLGDSKFFEQQKKHIIERREANNNKFLRYMGIIWCEAFYIYPVRSLLVWLFLFVLSVYFS